MARKPKIALLIATILLAALAIAVAVFDWNMLRGFIERQVTERSGRQLTIGGNLDVDLSATPRIRVEQVTFANAAWAKEPQMLDIKVAEFTLDLKQLFRGLIVLPEVALSDPVVALEKSADGLRNWVLKKKQTADDKAPVIQRLTVDNGTLLFRDPAIDTDLKIALNTDSAAADAKRALKFSAQGRFKGLAASASGAGGSVLSLQDQTLPYPISADIALGKTRATIDGTISGLATLSAIDLKLKLSGTSLELLYPILGIVTPPTPPYNVSGHLQRAQSLWTFDNFAGKVGDSDLSGDVKVETGGAKPKLTATLTSRVLDIDDLAGVVGGQPSTGPGETASSEQKQAAARAKSRPRALPDNEFRLNRLRAMDADVRLKAASIKREGLPLDDLDVYVLLNDGLLKLQPLNFGVAGGNVVSQITVDGRQPKIEANANIRFNKLQLNKLFPGIDLTKTSVGSLSGRAKLAGEGNSLARLLGTADGQIAAVITGGKISNLLLEFVGIDGAEIIKFLLAGDRNATLHCAVTEFKVTDGVMKSEVFVVDTSDTNISGTGTINLAKETLDLTLIPLPKDVSFLSGRSPLHVTGTFKDPNFAPDKSALLQRGGATVLLGALIGPLAALVPLIETGPGEDSDCKALVAAATKTDSTAKNGAATKKGARKK